MGGAPKNPTVFYQQRYRLVEARSVGNGKSAVAFIRQYTTFYYFPSHTAFASSSLLPSATPPSLSSSGLFLISVYLSSSSPLFLLFPHPPLAYPLLFLSPTMSSSTHFPDSPNFQRQSDDFISWLSGKPGVNINPNIAVADLRSQGAGRGVGTFFPRQPRISSSVAFVLCIPAHKKRNGQKKAKPHP